MRPWDIIGWFIVFLIGLSILGGAGYGIYRIVVWSVGTLPEALNYWVNAPLWIKWWLIPSCILVWLFAMLRVFGGICEVLGEEISAL